MYNFKLWLIESLIRVNDWHHLECILGGIYGHRLELTLNKYIIIALL